MLEVYERKRAQIFQEDLALGMPIEIFFLAPLVNFSNVQESQDNSRFSLRMKAPLGAAST